MALIMYLQYIFLLCGVAFTVPFFNFNRKICHHIDQSENRRTEMFSVRLCPDGDIDLIFLFSFCGRK